MRKVRLILVAAIGFEVLKFWRIVRQSTGRKVSGFEDARASLLR